MLIEIQMLAWDRHTNVAGLNRLMDSQSFNLSNWTDINHTDINKQTKNGHTVLHSKQNIYHHKMETQLSMRTIAWPMKPRSQLTKG